MDLQPLLQAVVVLGAFPAALVAILRFVLRGDDQEPTLFRAEQQPPWPRGVQEEEPIRYRVDLVTRSRLPSDAEARGPVRRQSVRPIQQRA